MTSTLLLDGPPRGAGRDPDDVGAEPADDAAGAPAPGLRPGSRRTPRPPAAGAARVLIIEDDPLSLLTLGDALRGRGFEVAEAMTAAEGLEQVLAGPPDAIVLDLALPDSDGLHLARRLQRDRRTKAIPVVAVTAFASVSGRERALEAGCVAYLAKPLPLAELGGLLAGLCRPDDDE